MAYVKGLRLAEEASARLGRRERWFFRVSGQVGGQKQATGSEGELVGLWRQQALWMCRQKQTRVTVHGKMHPILVQVNTGKKV